MPEAVAAAVVSFFSLTGTAAAVVGAAVQVAVIAGANAIVSNNSKEKQQGGLIDLQLNSAAPRQLVIGKRMVGGVLVDWYLAGSNNTKLYMPTYLAEGPCGQITRVFAGGREVFSTPLVHGVRTTIPDFRSGGDRLWLTYYDGRVGQSADATLVALGQGWTSANKMTGCAWVLVECQWDSDNMRSPPQLSFEMQGAKLYDRRKDTTAGGSGSHRIDSPATWEFSDNPAVALDHYLLGRYVGDVKTFGIGLSSDEVPYDRFAAQAAICDEDVDLKAGGTQKRYRANGFMFANEDYSSVIAKLCTAMAARPADFGGRFGVIGIESRTPVMTIDDGDMIAGVAEVYTPKRSWSELVGAIEGRFQDPAQLYQPVDYPRVTDAAWEAEDGGEPKVFTLDLEFETDVERAQRLATLRARAERRQATLRGVYPLKAVELERGDWFIRTGPKWGSGKTFEVIERALDTETWTVTIVSQEVDPADSAWDESVAQDGPPTPIAGTDTLSDVTAPSLTVTSNPIVGAASSTPAIKIAFTNPTDPRVRHMFIEVYRTSDGLKVATETVGIPDADGVVIIQNGIADAVAHTVRARYLTVGLSSAWSTSYAVTTGAGYSVGAATSVPWTGVTDPAGTRPDDDADVTLTHVASAITGQAPAATDTTIQAGATKNTLSFASSAPSSPTDGDIWVDTSSTPYVIKSRVAGAWQASGSYGGVFGATLYESGGGAVASLAAFKTISGTAAAIIGQGWGATASAADANNGRNGQFPVDFTFGVRDWFGGFGGDPASVADAPGAIVTESGEGTVYQVSGATDYLQPKMAIKSQPKRRYLVLARVRQKTNPSSGSASIALTINPMDSSFTHQSGDAGLGFAAAPGFAANVNPITSAGGWQTIAAIYTCPTTIPSTGVYWRPRLDVAPGTAGVAQVSRFLITDITDGVAGRTLTDLLRADLSTAVTESLIVTLLGTAAAIIGQGWGATASEQAARATRGRGVFRNSCFEEYVAAMSLPPQWSDWSGAAGNGSLVAKPYGDGYLYRLTGFAGANGGIIQQVTNAVQPGTSYLLTATAALVSGSFTGAGILCYFLNSGGSIIGTELLTFATLATTSGVTSASHVGPQRWEKLVTGPTGTVFCNLYVMNHWTSHGSVASGNVIDWYEADLIPMSLVAQLRADITASNTAGAITAQGNLATANYYYQSSDPGSVAAGSMWADTTTKAFKIRDAGAWKPVGYFSDFSVGLTANYSATHSSAGTMTRNVTATPVGGVGPFTYFWTVGDLYYGAKPTLTNNTTATVTVTKTFSNLLSISGIVNCLITDTATGKRVSVAWGYEDLATGSGDTSGGLPP